MSDRPTIALIGCGAIAHSAHHPSLSEGPYDLVAVDEREREKAAALVGALQKQTPRIYTDHRAMLAESKPDAVLVATPPMAHLEPTVDALAAGAHVLCEKPAALSAEEVVTMRDAAHQADRTLQFFSSRFRDPACDEAAALIARGELGRIYRAEIQLWLPYARACDAGRPLWFGQRKLAGGGVFYDMGQYFLDALFHMLSWPAVESVTAEAFAEIPTGLPEESGWDVEDHLSGLACLDGNISLTIETAARLHQEWRWGIWIMGTEAALHFDRTQPKDAQAVLWRYDADGKGECRSLPPASETPDCLRRLQALAQHLEGGPREPVNRLGTTPDEALFLTLLSEAIYQSAHELRSRNLALSLA